MAKLPDILIFLTDDHGQWASSAYGHGALHTPVMQWLADTGARMDNAFTPCPVCSPARASFLTGKIPSGHGVHDYIAENPQVPLAEWHSGISGQLHLGMLLRERGYRTGYFGKWHAGGGGEPVDGFDAWFSSLWGTRAWFDEQCYSENGKTVTWTGHQAQEITQRATEFLKSCKREHPEQPVFMVIGYVDTHTPHEKQAPWRVASYGHRDFPGIPVESFAECHGEARFPYDASTEKARAETRDYFAAVEWIDFQMGEVLEAARETGSLDSSLIAYLSDHGHMNGHHGLHTKANATYPQNFLEESIRIPWLMRWPEHIEEGIAVSAPVDHCDAFATILDAADICSEKPAAKDGVPRSGRSALPLFAENPPKWRTEQICEYGNARMIRTERHKLIRRSPAVDYEVCDELYDLAEDPRERENRIAEADPELLRDLDQRLESYFSQYSVDSCDGFDVNTYAGQFNKTEPWIRNRKR